MINPKDLYDLLNKNNIYFYTGVPDSLLKELCTYLVCNVSKKNHTISANEGNAVALAAGHYLATGNIGVVYLQNSGLGNIINPIVSLMDKEVYNIPVLFIIGWRGEPGKKDEPQHVTQGAITISLLEIMGIEYKILVEDVKENELIIKELVDSMKKNKKAVALLVRKNTFAKYPSNIINKDIYDLNREEVIKLILSKIDKKDIIVSTTGKTSREIYEHREELGQSHEKDFLTVGSMGHSLQIALGIALEKPERKIYCIDGDGALLMHMGGVAIVGQSNVQNLKHIVINNGSHDSVGGQPTVGFDIRMDRIAKACGYELILKAETIEEISECLDIITKSKTIAFLEIRVNKGARKNLGRPKETPIENKRDFMAFLENQ